MQISADLIKTLADMPRNTFQLLEKSKKNGAILYKFLEPADRDTIDSNPVELVLDNITIYSLRSLSVFFAYSIVFTNKIVDVHTEYVTVMRPSSLRVQQHTGVRHRHHDKNINVYESQDGASLIATNGISEIISTEMVRRRRNKD